MSIQSMEKLNFLWYIISTIVAIASGTGMIICGVFAQQGKRVPLFLGFSLYIIDMFCIIPLNFVGESTSNLWLIAGIHVIIIAFLAIAVYEYFNIIKIALKYNKLKGEE